MTPYLLIPFGVLLLAFFVRAPLGFGMLVGGVVYFVATGKSLGTVLNSACYGLFSSYILIAIPLFIFTANVMNSSAVTNKIFGFANALIGRARGGTGHVNVLASLIFAGMTGSALADAAGLGVIEIKQMKDEGYDTAFSCAITASSAVIGPIFPPSIPFVIYAVISGASIGKLFLGGMIPAFILAGVLMAYVAYIAKKRNYPRGVRASFRDFAKDTFNALPALFTPVVLLVGIYTGIMTPTEAAAVAALYAIVISMLVYRTLKLSALVAMLKSTLRTTGSIFLIVMGAYVFSYIIAVEQVAPAVAALLSGFTGSPAVFLIIVNILFLVLGCFVDVNVSVLVVLPIIVPMLGTYHIDPVHFGVMICLNMMIGLVTPPFGMLLFLTSTIGKCPMKDLIKEVAPMIGMLLLALVIIIVFPQTVLFATGLMR
jgi:tripartite ATP-independent transporter DctM subunit